jgi:serine/threonine-protein kinase RsbW
MDQPSGTSAGEHRITVASDTSEVASLRERICRFARTEGADESVVSDLELAVSELATNVVQHAGSPEITVVLRHEPDRWVLDVSNPPGPSALDAAMLPEPDALSGRGLFIVQAVMDDVEIVDDDGHRYVRCSKLVS